MDFLALARSRCSVREYEGRKVDDETLGLVLEAGRVAPTAANRQPQRILVLDTAEGLAKLATACNPHGAPLALVVFGERKQAWVRPFDHKDTVDIDTAIVTTHMMMEARGLGLGSCWLTYFDPQAILRAFQPPQGLEPIHVLVLGYAKGLPPDPARFDRDRRPLKDLVHYQHF